VEVEGTRAQLTIKYSFGEGVTREVGMDFANQKARKVGVFTDKTVGQLLPMKMAIESLDANGISYEIFDRTRVEPNQESCVSAPLGSRGAATDPYSPRAIRRDTGGKMLSTLPRSMISLTSSLLVVVPSLVSCRRRPSRLALAHRLTRFSFQ
jgi:hypothetical protein